MGVIDWSHISSAQGISSIVMFVATMVAMLTIFFFTYGAFLEREILADETDFVVKHFASQIKEVAPQEANAIKKSAQDWTPPDMSKANAVVAERNHKTVIKAAIAAASTFVFGLVFVGVMWSKSGGDDPSDFWHGFSLKDLAMDTTIMIVAVLVVEFMFATFVMKKFRSADPNMVVYEAIQGVKKSL
jgi:hypothetical protein